MLDSNVLVETVYNSFCYKVIFFFAMVENETHDD